MVRRDAGTSYVAPAGGPGFCLPTVPTEWVARPCAVCKGGHDAAGSVGFWVLGLPGGFAKGK